jgi:hypothetical protein
MAKAPLEIRSLARQHTDLAIRTLVQVAASKKAPESSRVAAASALLDRGWGKPKQEVEINQEVSISLADSLAKIAQLEHRQILDITPIDDDGALSIQDSDSSDKGEELQGVTDAVSQDVLDPEPKPKG